MSKLGFSTSKGFHNKVPFAEHADGATNANALSNVKLFASVTMPADGKATITILETYTIYLAILEGESAVFATREATLVSAGLGIYRMVINGGSVTITDPAGGGGNPLIGGEQLSIYKIGSIER